MADLRRPLDDISDDARLDQFRSRKGRGFVSPLRGVTHQIGQVPFIGTKTWAGRLMIEKRAMSIDRKDRKVSFERTQLLSSLRPTILSCEQIPDVLLALRGVEPMANHPDVQLLQRAHILNQPNDLCAFRTRRTTIDSFHP
ncbi:MAG: hypothetical protein AAF661_10405 [Pseudomonadota bacterium]